ncbi:MAG TPA: hypothetical protein VHP11_07975 [Tepidisphaeraceae bacterium]|nr:hypothetical protein [Tepidisphaeraceae bacterium]
MKNPQAGRLVLIVAAAGLGLAGCDRDEVTSYRAPKDPPRTVVEPPPTAVAPPASQPASAQRGEERRLEWTVPAEWTEMPARSMRYATFAVKGEPTLELAVFRFSPQPLLPNVNRWEGQLGLPPTPEAELGKVVRHLEVNGVGVELVDLLGPAPAAGQPRMQMLGAVINEPGGSWFFKMTGPAEKVGKQKAAFESFLKSTRFVGGKP